MKSQVLFLVIVSISVIFFRSASAQSALEFQAAYAKHMTKIDGKEHPEDVPYINKMMQFFMFYESS